MLRHYGWAFFITTACLIISFACGSAVAQQTKASPVPASPRTVTEQQTIEASLFHLVRQEQWELAYQLVRYYLGAPYHSISFLSLSIRTFLALEQNDEARELLSVARLYYPDHIVFIGQEALLLASSGQCHRATRLWSAYQSEIPFPVPVGEQAFFDRYCDRKVHKQAQLSLDYMSKTRGASDIGQSYIIAQEGSDIHQLCTALTGFCPADYRFEVARPPKPKPTLSARFKSQIYQRRHWRHELSLSLAAMRDLGGYEGRSAQLSFQWGYRLSAKRRLFFGTGMKKEVWPHAALYPRLQKRIFFASANLVTQQTQAFKTEFQIRHSSADIRERGQDRSVHYDDAHWGIYTTSASQIDLGVLFLAGWHRPPHDDAAGQSWQAGYHAHMTWHFQKGGQLQAGYLRRRTRYEKTLSYLLSPHRIVEKQIEISISKPLSDFPHIIPFVKVHRRMNHSTNLRQHGKSEDFMIGLSFRLN